MVAEFHRLRGGASRTALIMAAALLVSAPQPSFAESADAIADEALLRWHKATEGNHAPTDGPLGHLYKNGDGVAKNPQMALQWYRRAAEQGHTDAQFEFG